MKTVKSFLRTKIVSDISELDNGEVAIFNGKLYFRRYDGDISIVACVEEKNADIIVPIYGVRVNSSDVIERVFIERHISINGEINDIEKIGADSGLSFKAENHVFDNGKFSDLEPFKSMEEVETDIWELGKDSIEDMSVGKFVKLPIFFKNKEKTRLIDNVQYDYYLISPDCFEDFYPVESHKKGDVYVDCIYLESDWRQSEYKRTVILDVDDTNYADFYNNKLIDDVIFYCYLYYIYFIKTANFKPFKDINPQKKSVFICGAKGFQDFNGFESSMLSSLYNLSGGNISDLSDVLSASEMEKYPWYLKLSNGTNSNAFFENIFFEDCVYNINGYTNDSYTLPVSLVAHPRFFSEKESGCVFFLISELMELQLLDSGEDGFRANKTILNTDEFPYVIKLIPFFYSESNVYSSGFVREDENINNNTYTDSGNFCIDHLRNILPVFYNAYIPFEKNSSMFISETCRKLAYENYNVIINTGSASRLLSTMDYEKNLCTRVGSLAGNFALCLPYYNKNLVSYCNIKSLTGFDSGSSVKCVFKINNIDSFVVNSSSRYDNFIIRTNSASLGFPHYALNSGSDLCYLYKAVYFINNKAYFDWCSTGVYALSQQYEDYNISYYTDKKYGNNFFVSRLFYYPNR